MSENSRLAQIIAQAVGADGRVDRSKVFEGLRLTPDAPEALLLDVFLATEDALRTWRTDAPRIEAALVASTEKSIETYADQLRTQTDSLVEAATGLSDRVIRIAFGAGFVVGSAAMLAVHFLLQHRT